MFLLEISLGFQGYMVKLKDAWPGFLLHLSSLIHNRVPSWWQELITHGISGKKIFQLKNGFRKTQLFSIGLKKTMG